MEILAGHNKFYVNDAEGNQVAEIVFVPTGEHLSIIEHTDVDPSLKGQGVGKLLVAKVVEKMRAENRKVIPLCPFAKHEFDKNPRVRRYSRLIILRAPEGMTAVRRITPDAANPDKFPSIHLVGQTLF